MKFFASTSIALLLGACASTPTPVATPVVGAATRDASANYQVVTRGTPYDMPPVSGSPVANASGTDLERLRNATGAGFGASDANVTLAAGLLNGTYVAGISGTPSTGLPTSSSATYTGVWALAKSGVTINSSISLTADFVAGTLTGGLPAALLVDGRISGSSVTGTATLQGTDTGDIYGGFYGPAGSRTVALTILGPNMAGILVTN